MPYKTLGTDHLWNKYHNRFLLFPRDNPISPARMVFS